MKNVNRDLIFRIVCSVMTGICVLLLLAGWITVSDNDMRKTIKSGVRNVKSELKDIDTTDLKYVDELLDDAGINIKPRKIIQSIQKMLDIVGDAKISPAETVSLVPKMISMINVLEDEDVARAMGIYSSAMESALEEVSGYKAPMVLLMILFFITLICGILFTVSHALNKKYCGFTLAGLQLVMLIVFGIIVHSINSAAEDAFFDKIVRLTAAPFWALILSAGAAFIWFYREKIGNLLFGALPGAPAGKVGVVPLRTPQQRTFAQAGRTCPNCGTPLSGDVVFCPNCGTDTRRAPQAPTPAPAPAASPSVCSKCGMPLEPDMDFCPNCGTHR